MQCLPNNPILEFQRDTLEHVRKVYNLHEPGRIDQAIQILEEWISKQNHFTQKKFDRTYLERTIIFSKGSVERAKVQLDAICTYRTLLHKHFTNFSYQDEVKYLSDRSYLTLLPKMTNDHRRVFVARVRDYKRGDVHIFMKVATMICEYAKAHDYFQSLVYIGDYRGLNVLDIMTKINLLELQELFSIVLKGFDMRVSELHIINESKVFDFILSISKQLLSEKICSRIKMWDKVESVHQYVDRSILPVDLGGTERSLEELTNEWTKIFSSKEHVEYMSKMSSARTDESQRQAVTFNNMYMGTPGSFRNLVVD